MIRQDILVESASVDNIIAKWNGQNTNWIFLTVNGMILNLWVVCVRAFRIKKPQGRVIQNIRR